MSINKRKTIKSRIKLRVNLYLSNIRSADVNNAMIIILSAWIGLRFAMWVHESRSITDEFLYFVISIILLAVLLSLYVIAVFFVSNFFRQHSDACISMNERENPGAMNLTIYTKARPFVIKGFVLLVFAHIFEAITMTFIRNDNFTVDVVTHIILLSSVWGILLFLWYQLGKFPVMAKINMDEEISNQSDITMYLHNEVKSL